MAEVKRYVTPVFRASFPELFEAKSYDGGEPKYSVSAVWDPSKFSDSDKKRFAAIRKAMEAESQAKFGKPVKGLSRKGLRDGAEKADMEGYGEGTIFANLTTKMRPGVIDVNKAKIGPEEGNAEEIYPGCYCRATVTIYTYEKKGQGIALGLMNVQKVKDGERLDSRTDAEDDFDDDLDGEWLDDDSTDTDDFLD